MSLNKYQITSDKRHYQTLTIPQLFTIFFQKLQHLQEIDQGLVKPMPDNLQQRIHRLGNTKV